MALRARMRIRPVMLWMIWICASVSELKASAASATRPVRARELPVDGWGRDIRTCGIVRRRIDLRGVALTAGKFRRPRAAAFLCRNDAGRYKPAADRHAAPNTRWKI